MKKKLVSFAFIFVTSLLFAQVAPKKPVPSEYSWRILQEAQSLYDGNSYAKALGLALKAKENRREESKWESYTLDVSLSPLAVRKAGVDFDDVLPVLMERDQLDSVNIINKYLKLYSKKAFSNSVYKLKEWIEQKSVYPEADYLIGKIYQVEGEYESAYSFFEKARQNSEFLDIPDQIFDVLYSMAELTRQINKKEEYEQVLLLIMARDNCFKDSTLKTSILKIIDANTKENVDRFFVLFREESPLTLKALFALGKVYEEREEYRNSLFCSALGAIEGFTHVYNAICERDANFVYTTLPDFLAKTAEYQDILAWCEECNFWDTLILFAKKSAYRGNVIFANHLLRQISVNIPSDYYKAVAEREIIK